MASATPAPGYLDSLRALADQLLAGGQRRLELFTIELEEQKLRLIQTFLWSSAVVFASGMALTFASLTLVYLCWDTSRLAVLGGLTALYAGALVAVVLALRRHLARQPKPFAATLHELAADRACIRTGS
jgi:uncharacterized membrane protein YqjE